VKGIGDDNGNDSEDAGKVQAVNVKVDTVPSVKMKRVTLIGKGR